MEVPIAGSLRRSPEVAETPRKSQSVPALVGAAVGVLHPPCGAIGAKIGCGGNLLLDVAHFHSEALAS